MAGRPWKGRGGGVEGEAWERGRGGYSHVHLPMLFLFLGYVLKTVVG